MINTSNELYKRIKKVTPVDEAMIWKKDSNLRYFWSGYQKKVLVMVGIFCYFVVAGITTGCATVDEAGKQSCTVNISLVSRIVNNAGDVSIQVQAEGVDHVFVPFAGPQVFKLDANNVGELTTDSTCTSISIDEDIQLRIFHFDTGLWTSAWDNVASVDEKGLYHISAGFYKIVLVYSMEKDGQDLCQCVSAPFEVMKPSIWMVEN